MSDYLPEVRTSDDMTVSFGVRASCSVCDYVTPRFEYLDDAAANDALDRHMVEAHPSSGGARIAVELTD